MSLEAAIDRKTELVFCRLLTEAVSDLRIIAHTGLEEIPTEEESEAIFIPPYAVFAVMGFEEVGLAGSSLYQIEARLALITDIDHTSASQHSKWLTDLKAALDGIARPYLYPDEDFQLNGCDILGKWEPVEDDRGQCQCHAIPLAIGASG